MRGPYSRSRTRESSGFIVENRPKSHDFGYEFVAPFTPHS